MSKNKYFKKLLVAGLCALTATATVGTTVTAAGCKKDDNNQQQQTQEYNIVWDLDGGSWSQGGTNGASKVEHGAKVAKPTDPVRNGHTFTGWVKEDGTAFNFETETVTSNLKLKAVWTANGTASYTVTWNLDGGTWSGAALPTTVPAGGKINKVSGPSKTGYDFVCWLGADGKEYDFNTAVNANITLIAKYEKHAYTVMFKFDDKVFDVQRVPYKDTAKTIATDPQMPGKIFDGWRDADGKAFDFTKEITADTVISASWTDKHYDSYVVSFDTNGGSEVAEQNVTVGGKAQKPTDPTRDNFKFAGWYADAQLTEEFDFAAPVTKATTLYAKWSLADGVTGVTESSTWEFNSGNVASNDEDNNYFVATSTTLNLQGTTGTFHGLEIDATTGKLTDNGGQWYQFNATTKITIAVADTCSVKLTMYNGSTEYSVNGEAANTTHTYNFYGANTVTIESTGNGYIGKIELVYPEAMEPIAEDTTILFGNNGNENYQTYVDGGKLSISGSIRGNGDNSQIGTETIKFGVNAGAEITVNSYGGYTHYKIGMEGGDLSEEQTGTTYTYTALKAGNVVIVGTDNNNYYYSIVVKYKQGTGTPEIPSGYELVKTNADLDAAMTLAGGSKVKVPAGGLTVGRFKFEKDAYFDTTGGISGTVVNNQKTKIYFDITGLGNGTLTFDAKGASAGTLKLYKADGTEVKNFGSIGSAVQLGLTATELEAGSYYLWSADGSVRIGNISITEILEKGQLASLEVKPAITDFLAGNEFTTAGLSSNAVYTNGSKRSQSNITVDSSSVDMTKEGEYIVRVFYTESGETATAAYTVKVYTAKTINLYTYKTSGTKQTNLKKVYVKDGKFDTDGLTAKIKGTCGETELEFTLASGQFDVSQVDLSAVGEKTVTVSAKGNSAVYAVYTIYVVEKTAVENNTVTVSVDASKDVTNTNFKTVTDALVYLANYDAEVKKVVNIADGVYNEKVIVNIPNVQLIGSSTKTPDANTDNGVVISFDALAGKKDPSGANYGTNGSATVTVTAAGFVAKNITFKNYYNTHELYTESTHLVSDTQAVALYVDSAQAEFYDCKMTSYHDTLYANKGKQYYYNCWIEGRTDYIFGQDAIVYFNGCTIHTVSAGNNDGNGGYVVALKPSGANTYYFVFNNCDFTGADEGATNIALGRAWGADMKMVVMNSAISANYSVAAHTQGTTKGQRYCTMSGNEPKAGNMLEYNNTGAGAISASIENTCTVIDQTAAAAYDVDKLATILGFAPEKVN